MRALNTSLPKSSTRSAPPEELLQAFRTAALSVTNLYKSAVTDQSNGRQEGYQDALDDLLVFLDNQNIGLQDGEGWSIRQWINERHDRSSLAGQLQESDDEAAEAEKRPRSSSPVELQPSNHVLTHTRSYSQPPPTVDTPVLEAQQEPPQTAPFRFLANQDTQMQSEATLSQPQPEVQSSSPQPIRLGLTARASRTPRRTARTTRESAYLAGTKRKFQVPDFFDFSNINFGRDGNGSGASKRGKFA